MDNLKQPLQNLGFSEKEVDIYTALLELGVASYTDLAKASRIKRTTLYTIVQSMEERGFVRYSIDTRELTATPPDQLFSQLQANALQFHKFIPYLKELGQKKRSLSRVQFYAGKEGIKQVYSEMELELPPKKDRIIRVISDGDTWDSFWQGVDVDFTKKYLQERRAKHYTWKILASGNNQGSYSSAQAEKYNFSVKNLPDTYKVEFDMEIHHSHIIITDLKSEQPYAIKIVGTELAQAMTNFFEFTWNLYKENPS